MGIGRQKGEGGCVYVMQCMRGITELAYVYSCLKLGVRVEIKQFGMICYYTGIHNTILALTSFATCEEMYTLEHPTA